MVGARRREQQRFGARAPAIGAAGQQQRADRFRALAPARLARFDDVQTTAPQGLGQGAQLRRLACPLPAFQRDEPAARHPNSDFRPFQSRPNMPASATSSPATSGITCGAVSWVWTISCAICWPLAIGALIGPV